MQFLHKELLLYSLEVLLWVEAQKYLQQKLLFFQPVDTEQQQLSKLPTLFKNYEAHRNTVVLHTGSKKKINPKNFKDSESCTAR